MSLRDIFAKHGDAIASTKAASPDPLPPGTYTAEIDRCEVGRSRNNHECLKLTFRVTAGDHANRRFWLDMYFTPDAMKYTKAHMDALGVTAASPADWWKGVRVEAVLTVRESDHGNRSNKVKSLTRTVTIPHPADLPPPAPVPAPAAAKPKKGKK